jgi:DNA recombination protein RmuC
MNSIIGGAIFGSLLTIVVIAVLYFFIFKKSFEKNSKNIFETLASKVFEEKIGNIVDISSKLFNEKREEIKGDLSEKENKFNDLINQIKSELKSNQNQLTEFEQKRIETFTRLQEEISRQDEITKDLRLATSKINQILSNSRLRGQYGQKIAEDILKASGLLENTHYIKEKQQETVATRPDFTFLLPDEYRVNMDVKFPLDNFVRMVDADNAGNQDGVSNYKKQFLSDIKAKIGEVTSRDYINPKENTLDYVMLFVPNENVSSFIYENFPEIFDLAIQKHVAFVSPYQLFGFVSVIRQSFENFYYEKSIRTVISLINIFMKHFEAFKKKFINIGESLEDAKEVYAGVKEQSFKNLDSVIARINDQKHNLPVETDEEN